MDDFNDDPLDLLQDDDDGVIETILLLDEDDNKSILTRAGCLGFIAIVALPASLIFFGLSFL